MAKQTVNDGRVVSVRLSGWYSQLWRQLREALPGRKPSDLVRRSLLVAAVTLFEDEEGERPDVFIRNPHSGSETRLYEYLDGLIEQAAKPVRLLRGAAKPRDESYEISLKVFGFYHKLYDQIADELYSLSPPDVIRRCLLVLAATLLKDSDGNRPEVYIRGQGGEAELLDTFLGLDAP